MKIEKQYTKQKIYSDFNKNNEYHQNPFLGKQNFDEVNFSSENLGKDVKLVRKNKPIFKKLAAYICGGLLTLGGISQCTDETPKVSDFETIDNVKVNYFNVEKETRDSLLTPFVTLKSKLTPENDFLDELDVDITGKYKDLDDANSFRKFLKSGEHTDDKACSFYSDGKLKRRIVVQEGAHGVVDKFYNLTTEGKYSALPAMRHTLMHEVGHQFDYYFGHDHNADFAVKWDSIMAVKEQHPDMNPYVFDILPREAQANIDFFWNSGLSDKEEFYNAIIKDYKHIAELNKNNSDKIGMTVLSSSFVDGIDLTKPITYEVVDAAELARTEVYANLFSYAIGENDGDKSRFVENFKNAYRVVKKDIKEHLHIDVDAGMKVLKKVR